MTSSLIKKEFILTAHPMTYVMAFFGAMLLIPSYPYYICFFYATLGIFFDFMNARENKDYYYMSVLPVSKRDIVRAKSIFVVIIELVSIAFAVPFAFITNNINPNGGNLAGIDANVAFFGLSFIMYAIFNVVFITTFFKSAYKAGKSYLFSCIAMGLFIIAAESSTYVPMIGSYLDTTDITMQIKQLPILAAGIAIYIITYFITVKKATANFEKVDL